MKQIVLYIAIIAFIAGTASCNKDQFYTGSSNVLSFEEDTLTFDTVFTSIGTITRYFKVYNTSKQDLLVDKIKIVEENASPFRINVDGVSVLGSEIENVEILAEDYIYIFVEATLGENNASNPLIIVNELQYSFNGNTQSSYLQAWGQDAYFHFGEILSNETVTWPNDKPHVVVRSSSFPGFGVDSFSTLNILPGTEVFVATGAAIFVEGALNVGLPNNMDSVTFQSDRIEDLPNGLTFDETAGLWFGIVLFGGSNSSFYNARIQQARFGITGRDVFGDYGTYTTASRPDILLDKVIIKNTLQAAVLALNSKLTATNCLFYSAGGNLVTLALGGDYNISNCTFYNSGGSGLSHEDESLAISNFASNSRGGAIDNLDNANITNCIIYGTLSEELLLNKEDQAMFNFAFNNSLIRTEQDVSGVNFTNCVINEDPLFESSSDRDFRLSENSPCIDVGSDLSITITNDIEFSPRSIPFDIGAFEFQQ